VTGAAALMRGCLTIALGFAAAGCATSDGHDTGAGLSAPPPAIAPERRPKAAEMGGGDVEPQQLLGLDQDQLTALLGPADFTRSDGPAEIRQFRDPDCVLDVFLYQEPSNGGYRVEHVQARDRGLVRTAGRTCVAALMRARRIRAVAG
jgi:hypothetical protein